MRYYCLHCGSDNTYVDLSLKFSKCIDCSFISDLSDLDLQPIYGFSEDVDFSINSQLQAVDNFSNPISNSFLSVSDRDISFDDIPF